MKIVLAQLNPTIGDFDGNLDKIRSACADAYGKQADLVVFPELFLSGYPPLDLLQYPPFVREISPHIDALKKVTQEFGDMGVLVGTPYVDAAHPGKLFNSALMVVNGEIAHVAHKMLLPTYDVFDEARYFNPAEQLDVIPFKGHQLGTLICEDGWQSLYHNRYVDNPVDILAKKGATILINLSASPFDRKKVLARHSMFSANAKSVGLPYVFLNMVGGNDELVFDGNSMVFNANGELVFWDQSFAESCSLIELDPSSQPLLPVIDSPQLDDIAQIHDALVLGLNDYARKCRFTKVVLGLSGGIDSAVTAALAVEALGAENVVGVSMPSEVSSQGSKEDARKLADNLGIELITIPISDTFESIKSTLAPAFMGQPEDVTEENLQARIRGIVLMALSNKFGYLLLSTGNKSEMAVGYCTLYGDMNGGLAVLSDVPKTVVYQLARYMNQDGEKVPVATIEKPPSAELRPNQTDQDSLPDYEVLDAILEAYIEEKVSRKDIIARGYDAEVVQWIINAVNRNEYKRRQAPPGFKVTSVAFGIGRRMPIAARA